jgi:hypothetical protein
MTTAAATNNKNKKFNFRCLHYKLCRHRAVWDTTPHLAFYDLKISLQKAADNWALS